MGTPMEEAFKHFDKDGCGSITSEGFSAGLREMGVFQEFSDEEVEQVRHLSLLMAHTHGCDVLQTFEREQGPTIDIMATPNCSTEASTPLPPQPRDRNVKQPEQVILDICEQPLPPFFPFHR